MSLYRADGRPPFQWARPPAMIADFEARCVLGDNGLWRFQSHVPYTTRIVPVYPKIADQVTRGGAVLSSPSIEGTDFFRSFEPVVADREKRLAQIKLVRPGYHRCNPRRPSN